MKDGPRAEAVTSKRGQEGEGEQDRHEDDPRGLAPQGSSRGEGPQGERTRSAVAS